MYRNPTVKNLKDALETMRKVYDFKDEKTVFHNRLDGEQYLRIATVDEETGVHIEMCKDMLNAAEEAQE